MGSLHYHGATDSEKSACLLICLFADRFCLRCLLLARFSACVVASKTVVETWSYGLAAPPRAHGLREVCVLAHLFVSSFLLACVHVYLLACLHTGMFACFFVYVWLLNS